MRIEFSRIELHNFLSFADETFQFPKSPGLNLVCGVNYDIDGAMNGCGKSALFSGLVFALFGQMKDDIKVEHIHNRYVKGKDVRVAVWLNAEDEYYKIVSGLNNAGKSYCELYKIKDGSEVNITKSSMSETRKFITDEILQCDMSIFLRTILLSSDQNYNFFRLKKASKKEFIEKLFDISVFKTMFDSIHKETLLLDKQMISMQNQLLVLNKNNDAYLQQSESYVEAKAARQKKLSEQQHLLEKQQMELKSKKIKTNAKDVEECTNKLQRLSDEVAEHESRLKALNAKDSKADIAASSLLTEKKQKQIALDKHKDILQKLCKDCAAKFKRHYNLDTYETSIVKVQKKLLAIQQFKKSISADKGAEQSQIDSLNAQVVALNAQIRSLTSEFNDNTRKLAVVEQQLLECQSKSAALEVECNPYATLIENNQIQLQKQKNAFSELSDKYKHLKFAEDIVSQDTIRKFIISDLISLLNNKIRYYLSKFGANYHVMFDSDMNYEFKTSNGTCEYDNFSSGERARIMIATCFAFRDFMRIKNNLSSNILVLDEFIDNAIDSLAIESIIDILKDFSKVHKQNIYVISHRKEAIASDNFTVVIQVQKKDNISSIKTL